MRDDGGADAAVRWRLFVGLPVPRSAALAIHGSLAAHRDAYPAARWLHTTLYHVTLRFLGSVDARLVPDLVGAVVRAAWGVRPFTIVVGRGGGVRGRSGAAWLDVLEGRARVEALAERLDRLLPVELRASLNPGRPAPHLTVARRAPGPLAHALADGSLGVVRATWVADRLTLFRSHTGTPAGSRYEPVAEAALHGAPGGTAPGGAQDAAAPGGAQDGAAPGGALDAAAPVAAGPRAAAGDITA